jgi:hypothetical protein
VLGLEPDEHGSVFWNSNDRFRFLDQGQERILWRNKTNAIAVYNLNNGEKLSEWTVAQELPEGSPRRRYRDTASIIEGFDWDPKTETVVAVHRDQSHSHYQVSIAKWNNEILTEQQQIQLPRAKNQRNRKFRFVARSRDTQRLVIGISQSERPATTADQTTSVYSIQLQSGDVQKLNATMASAAKFLAGGSKIVQSLPGRLTVLDIDSGELEHHFVQQDVDQQSVQVLRIDRGWAIASPRQIRLFDEEWKLLKTVLKSDWSTTGHVAVLSTETTKLPTEHFVRWRVWGNRTRINPPSGFPRR